jgi:hypothetical protein
MLSLLTDNAEQLRGVYEVTVRNVNYLEFTLVK